jgi:hypothetical protein
MTNMGVVGGAGVVLDASLGAVFRLRGTAGGARDTVEVGANGLLFGGDAEVSSPNAGSLLLPPLIQVTPSSTANEGGEIQLLGEGTDADWAIDNYDGYLRFHSGGVVRWSIDPSGIVTNHGKVRGGVYSGSTAVTLTTSPLKLDLSTTDDGESAFLTAASDRVTIPTGGAGLYTITAQVSTPTGVTGANWFRVLLYKNGSNVGFWPYWAAVNSASGGAIIAWTGYLADADYIEVYAHTGSGVTAGTARTEALTITRIGNDWAA